MSSVEQWSGFNGGTPQAISNTDILVGLRSGVNYQFSIASLYMNLMDGAGTGSIKGGDLTTSNAAGNYSFAFGANTTTASALGALAFGNASVASGNYSFAFGSGVVTASGLHSFAFGDTTVTASGDYSFAMGYNSCIASGDHSFCFGFDAAASPGDYSFAFGNTPTADGDNAFAFGAVVSAGGNFSLAFGSNTSTTAAYSLAFGNTAAAGFTGSWVIGDSNATPAPDSAANQFCASFAGGFHLSTGSLNIKTAGNGLAVAEGSNAKQGTVSLVLGVGVVSNTAVTANSRIMYNAQDTNTTGYLKITARTTGSGFTITSSNLADTGVVAYQIFEPAA